MGSRKKIWRLVVVLLCGLLWGGELFAITTAPYFPIQEGNSWTYNNNVTGTYTTTVLNGTVPVNGVATFVLQDSDGLQSYITNDQNGIRLHRQYEPLVWIDGLGYASFDVIYSSPMKMADAETAVGASIFSSGSAITTVTGLGTFSLTYSLTSSIDGLETVTVPAGTYQAVKITRTLTIAGNIQGTYVSETSTDTVWLVKDIGEVKYLGSSTDGIEEELLTVTNVAPQVIPAAGANGIISPNTAQYIAYNDTITFTVTPDPLYLIDSVTGCGGTLTGNSYTTAPVSGDCDVVATFYSLQYSESAEFVRQVYLDFLNRETDAEGLNYWVIQLEAGVLDRSEMVEQFLLSAEFQGNIAPVVRLYFTYYLRLPDYDGLMFWVNAFSAGMGLEAISDEFAKAPEFIELYGDLTNEQFVTQMYLNVYERAPDSEGLFYWTGQLDDEVLTRGQVMVAFATAEEYLSLSANQVYVSMTYIGLLRRVPEQEGFNYWVSIMNQGASGLALIDEFLMSEEYQARFTP